MLYKRVARVETWVTHFSMRAARLYYLSSLRYYLMKAVLDN